MLWNAHLLASAISLPQTGVEFCTNKFNIFDQVDFVSWVVLGCCCSQWELTQFSSDQWFSNLSGLLRSYLRKILYFLNTETTRCSIMTKIRAYYKIRMSRKSIEQILVCFALELDCTWTTIIICYSVTARTGSQFQNIGHHLWPRIVCIISS